MVKLKAIVIITTSITNGPPGTSLIRITRGIAIAPSSTLLYIFVSKNELLHY